LAYLAKQKPGVTVKAAFALFFCLAIC